MKFSRKTKLIPFILLAAFLFLTGCGSKPKAETPPGGTPAAQQATGGSDSGSQRGEESAQPGGGALTAREAVALAESNARKVLGNEADVVKLYGEQEGTAVDGRAADWEIVFANPARKSLVVEIKDGRISLERSGRADVPLKEAAGGKWIDSVKAAETARAGGGDSFKHTVVNPSVNYTLGRLDEIAWYGDKKAGVIKPSDRRPAWRVTYDNREHYYVDALSGALIAKGSYQNRP